MPDESPAVWLVLMKGFPATGKSELAYALARRLRWPLVDKDDIKDVILSCPDSNRPPTKPCGTWQAGSFG